MGDLGRELQVLSPLLKDSQHLGLGAVQVKATNGYGHYAVVDASVCFEVPALEAVTSEEGSDEELTMC